MNVTDSALFVLPFAIEKAGRGERIYPVEASAKT